VPTRFIAPAGHVYSLDFPPAYNSWDRVDPLELFEAQPVKNESNPKVRQSAANTQHSTACGTAGRVQAGAAFLPLRGACDVHACWQQYL
jgi:hypothetical protein